MFYFKVLNYIKINYKAKMTNKFIFFFIAIKTHFHARKILIEKKINKIIMCREENLRNFQKILEYKVTL